MILEYIFANAGFGLVVFGGSLIKVLKSMIDNANGDGRKVSKLEIAYDFLSSMFSGTVFFLLAHQFIDSYPVLVGLSGMGSFLGVNGMATLFDILMDMLRKKTSETKTPEQQPTQHKQEVDDWSVQPDQPPKDFGANNEQ